MEQDASVRPAARIPALDGLRGLAATAVLSFHAWLYALPGFVRRSPLFAGLHLALMEAVHARPMGINDVPDIARVERHALGPRLFLLGRRIHECHAGVALLLVAAVFATTGVPGPALALITALGLWMVLKDWRDFFPSLRDTAAWTVGFHRPPGARRARPARDRIPLAAALLTAAAGAINVASALTPELPARVAALMSLAPVKELEVAHALALPAGLALIAVARQLLKRRLRALHAAVALLAAIGLFDLVKGLDVEEALLSWGVAGALWHWRATFTVRPQAAALGRSALRAGSVVVAAYGAGLAATVAAAGSLLPAAPLGDAPVRALQLLTFTASGVHAAHPYAWLPLGLGLLGASALSAAAAILFAPLRPLLVQSAGDRARAADVVRRHGSDTLSAFKLRSDLHRRWSSDGRAFAAYGVRAGTLLVAGDPVGPPGSAGQVIDRLRGDAARHGLAFAAVGASEGFAELAHSKGLHRLYLGDEAIVAAGAIDLEGRSNKNLRNALRRVARNGYTAAVHEVGDMSPQDREELQAVSTRWLAGGREQGFSMAHDRLVDELIPDALAVVARDGGGNIRGFLLFTPVFGRPLVSLAFMRRDRDTPNGLTEFLVAESARLLGERGIEEFSLNFSAFGRFLRAPRGRLERLAGHGLRQADRWFQIERLLRFNARFNPRWLPRYLIVDRISQLPRVAFAALAAEGQLPQPVALRRALIWRSPAPATITQWSSPSPATSDTRS